jgi:hypothetical protein
MAKKKKTITFLFSLFIFCMSFSVVSAVAHAEPTQYGPVTIDLPTGWNCQTEDPNMICLDESGSSEKTSAIVISYKRKSPEDDLVVYKDQLSRPRQLQSGEVSVPSQVIEIKNMVISDTTWIEGVHLNAEVTDYYTHYYATVTGDWAVLASMSIHKDTYAEQLPKLKASIQNIILNPHFQLLSGGGAVAGGNQMDGAGGATPLAYGTTDAQNHPGKYMTIAGVKVKKLHLLIGLGLLLVLGLLGYAVMMD